MRLIDRLVGIGLVVLGAAVLNAARSFPNVPGQQLGASTLPSLVGAALIVCALVLIVRSFRAGPYRGAPSAASSTEAGSAPGAAARERIGPPLALIACVLLYVFASETVGFLLIAPACLLIGFTVLGIRLGRAIAWSLAASLVVHLVFYKMLKVPLPWGWIPVLY